MDAAFIDHLGPGAFEFRILLTDRSRTDSDKPSLGRPQDSVQLDILTTIHREARRGVEANRQLAKVTARVANGYCRSPRWDTSPRLTSGSGQMRATSRPVSRVSRHQPTGIPKNPRLRRSVCGKDARQALSCFGSLEGPSWQEPLRLVPSLARFARAAVLRVRWVPDDRDGRLGQEHLQEGYPSVQIIKGPSGRRPDQPRTQRLRPSALALYSA
jgi:hypothetical protein